MKKFGLALLCALLATTMLVSFVGCKGADDLGADAGKWTASVDNDESMWKKLVITIDKPEAVITGWAMTDETGAVLAAKTGANALPLDPICDEVLGTTEDGSKVTMTFTFNDKFFGEAMTRDIILYTYMPTYEPKKLEDADGNKVGAGKADYRGKITIQKGAGVKIDATGYKEEVTPVSIYVIANNEYSGDKPETSFPLYSALNGGKAPTLVSGSWSGTYEITGITVFKPDTADAEFGTAKFEQVQSLNIDLSANPIKEGTERAFIVATPPADSYYAIGLTQPNRITENDDQNKAEEQKNWVWAAKYETETHGVVTRASAAYDGKIIVDGDAPYKSEEKKASFAAPTLYELLAPVEGEK